MPDRAASLSPGRRPVRAPRRPASAAPARARQAGARPGSSRSPARAGADHRNGQAVGVGLDLAVGQDPALLAGLGRLPRARRPAAARWPAGRGRRRRGRAGSGCPRGRRGGRDAGGNDHRDRDLLVALGDQQRGGPWVGSASRRSTGRLTSRRLFSKAAPSEARPAPAGTGLRGGRSGGTAQASPAAARRPCGGSPDARRLPGSSARRGESQISCRAVRPRARVCEPAGVRPLRSLLGTGGNIATRARRLP